VCVPHRNGREHSAATMAFVRSPVDAMRGKRRRASMSESGQSRRKRSRRVIGACPDCPKTGSKFEVLVGVAKCQYRTIRSHIEAGPSVRTQTHRNPRWLMAALNCFESPATIRIPNPRLLSTSKPAGNPTPSSRTDMRAVFSSCRAKRTQMCPSERSEKAYLAALVTSSLGQRNRSISTREAPPERGRGVEPSKLILWRAF
jgi:hypothetical protein